MRVVDLVGVGKEITVVGSEVEPGPMSVGVVGVEEGHKGPVSLVGESFGKGAHSP